MHVREARCLDLPAINALVKRAPFTSPSVWRWEAHLTDKGFLVVEARDRIEGALLATSDASPVAWIRLAAVDSGLPIGCWLDLSLPPLLSHLGTAAVRELAWMDNIGWGEMHLEKRGFRPLNEVITLRKSDRTVPPIAAPPINLRPAMIADFAALAAIDRRAFSAAWWRSEATLRRRATTASHFTVAEREGEPVGYTERTLHPPTGHLNRIAVDPEHQRLGIGGLLLKRALAAMWQGGAGTVSLNTQRSNPGSRRLYERFGFEPTGDSVIVWTRQL